MIEYKVNRARVDIRMAMVQKEYEATINMRPASRVSRLFRDASNSTTGFEHSSMKSPKVDILAITYPFPASL